MIKYYRRAIKLDSNYSLAYNSLGNALSEGSMIEETIVHYRRAISLDPTYSNAYNGLGNALRANKKIY